MANYNKVVFHKLPKTEKEDDVVLEKEGETDKVQCKINLNQILGISLGLLHYTCAGILSGYASVIVTQLKDTNSIPVTKSEATWIASIVVIPMAPSCLITGYLLNIMPKKTLLIIITLIEIASWLTIYMSTSVTGILIGRALNGVPSSMGSPIIPPFLGEISHPNMRGLYLSMVMLGISLGLIIIHTLGAFFTWNVCALITAIILLVYLCLVIYLRETYVWHMRNNNQEQAKSAFYWYRGHNADSKKEIDKLLVRQEENAAYNYNTMDMLKICCSKFLLMPLLITVVGMITMHLSGTKAIMFHSISIVSKVIPSLNQYASTIIVDAIRILITLVSCVLIKKFPVRPLFIISGIGSALSHLCFAGFNYYSSENSTDSVFPVLALIALLSYIVFSTIGIAPLAWVIAGEIFPLIVKGIGSGLCCFVYFLTFFIVVKLTPDLFELFGISGGFLFFGGCTMLGTVTMYYILPETKNKTLREIEDLFR